MGIGIAEHISFQNHDLSEFFLPSAGIIPLPSTIFYCHKSLSFEPHRSEEQTRHTLIQRIKALNLEPYFGNGSRAEAKAVSPFIERLKSRKFKPSHENGSRRQEETVPESALLLAGGRSSHLSLYHHNPTKIIKETYQEELDFYTHLAPKLDTLLEEPYRGSWRPSIHSWEKSLVKRGGRDQAFIVLENIAPVSLERNVSEDPEYFWHPNILDIKLGRRLHGDKSKPLTIVRKKRLAITTTSNEFGMRLTGAQVQVMMRRVN
ncbi:hypothetical protein PTTG_28706 [Puccinia triticina 1-1 BBBD Race 1]|uniref:Kinase n=1 Tax=Puccinia triticina (isolate 1-1 / race 1 (BBBD)) TaxID=630390 RepID=A0A180G9M5_PUCT1|nr:hypothetical protein PTTG_28706 [Puccinia triticina 1-1 BBBD Race 1]